MPDVDDAATPVKGTQRPDPDPTVLTTQALFREIAQLRELFNTKIDTITQTVESALENATNARTGIKMLLEQRIDAVTVLYEAKLDLIERQRVEQKSDTAAAVQAALSAAKEAVKEQTAASERSIAKSEAQSKQSTSLILIQRDRDGVDIAHACTPHCAGLRPAPPTARARDTNVSAESGTAGLSGTYLT